MEASEQRFSQEADLFAQMMTSSDKPLNVEVLSEDISMIYKHLVIPYKSSGAPLRDCKSDARSRDLCKQGYDAIKNEKYVEAGFNFSVAVANASNDSKELTSAYAGRSLALFRLRNYSSCLLDVNRALEGDISPAHKKTLRERKKQCLQLRKMALDYEVARLKTLDVSDENVDELFELREGSHRDEGFEWIDLIKFGNDLLPNTSTKIKLKYNEKWGRHMVATEEIKPGEVLSSEEFFIMMTNAAHCYSHCSYCLILCDTLISCPSCTKVMYCSQRCRKEAFNSYHRTECQMIIFFERNVDDPREQTALRAFLYGTNQGTELSILMESLTRRDIFNKKADTTDQFYENDYISIINLLSTFDDKISLIKRYSIPAVEIIIFLLRLNFFRNETLPDDLGEKEIFATLLLINHLISVGEFNHAVLEMIAEPRSGPRFLESRIGIGISSLHSLINHSCNANTCALVQNRHHVLYAIRSIQPGEQLFFSYYQSYAFESIENRAEKCLNYGFSCKCEACENNWPLITHLKQSDPVFRPVDLASLGANLSTMMNMTQFIVGACKENISERQKIQIVTDIRGYIVFLHKHLESPSFEIVLCEELLIKFMSLMFSDHYGKYFEDVLKLEYLESRLAYITTNVSKAFWRQMKK